MEYQMHVVIEDPNVKPGMFAELSFDFTCYFTHHPKQYGNGYTVSIASDNFEERLYDLRYDKSFNRNKKADWLKAWAYNYWSGKNGAWKVKSLIIKNTLDDKLKSIIEGICVNGPQYRDDRIPDFNKYSINESKFVDRLRFKNYTITYNKGQVIIDWISQEPVTSNEALIGFKEFCRAIKDTVEHLCKDFEGSLKVYATMSDRDGINSYMLKKTLTF